MDVARSFFQHLLSIVQSLQYNHTRNPRRMITVTLWGPCHKAYLRYYSPGNRMLQTRYETVQSPRHQPCLTPLIIIPLNSPFAVLYSLSSEGSRIATTWNTEPEAISVGEGEVQTDGIVAGMVNRLERSTQWL